MARPRTSRSAPRRRTFDHIRQHRLAEADCCGRLTRLLSRLFARYLREALRRVGARKQFGTDAGLGEDFWDGFRAELTEVFASALQDAFARAYQQAGGRGPANELAARWARQHAFRAADQVAGSQADLARAALSRWLAEGGTFDELVADLEAVFGPNRVRMIAVTEATRTVAQAEVAAWREHPLVARVRYWTAADEAVCPICEDDHGRELGLAEAEDLIPQHPNCRCFYIPVLEGEEEEEE
jgi:SPP1 gp7 family putative phage head morphogenesis protein